MPEVVLVTGAVRGPGTGIEARVRGHRVVATGRRPEEEPGGHLDETTA